MTIMVEKPLNLSGFTKHPYRQKRLKPYFDRMSKDRLGVVYDDNVADSLRAQGFSIEESPRSVYKVEKLYEQLSGYEPSKNHAIRPSTSYKRGVALAYACYARPADQPVLHVLPLTPETVVAVTSNPSGSPGVTNYGCTKQESQQRALERGLQTLKGEKKPEPCLAFARTQFNDKTRLIWGYPYSMTVIEGMLAKNLLEVFKGGITPMAFAMTTLALGTKLQVASYHKEWAYSIDMSQFDATISSELIHTAFNVLRTWYDLDEVEPVSRKTVREIFKLVERYFIHTAIVMPDGNIYYGKNHGVPSGSYFTQIVNSVVNVIIAGTISDRFGLNVSKRELFVLGDDLLMWTNRKMSLDTIAAYANDTFGVKMHGSEKSKIFHYDEPIHFLGRDWTNGLPDLAIDEVTKRMAYPERFRKYSPDERVRSRQVRMLILSYAAVYRCGWQIASKLLVGGGYARQGCANTDVNTFCDGSGIDDMDADYLSGLARYRRKFHHEQVRGDIPITGTQYWL
jgi:hypothetical protein